MPHSSRAIDPARSRSVTGKIILDGVLQTANAERAFPVSSIRVRQVAQTSHRLTAVHRQCLADDVTRFFTAEEQHDIGDVLRIGNSASGDAADHRLAVEPAGGEIGQDPRGRHMAGRRR